MVWLARGSVKTPHPTISTRSDQNTQLLVADPAQTGPPEQLLLVSDAKLV